MHAQACSRCGALACTAGSEQAGRQPIVHRGSVLSRTCTLTVVSCAVCLDLLDANTTQQAISSGVLPAKFDLVVSHMVLHHVEDAAAAVASLSKLLRQEPQGRLVLTDLFATERTKYFHPASVHHTVSHLGEQQRMGCGAGLTAHRAGWHCSRAKPVLSAGTSRYRCGTCWWGVYGAAVWLTGRTRLQEGCNAQHHNAQAQQTCSVHAL